MVKAFCCLLFLLYALPSCALSPHGPQGHALAAQDGQGTIWAVDFNTSGAVLRWTAAGWQAQAFPEANGFVPVFIQRGDDGAVYALWQSSRSDQSASAALLVTVHRGGGSRILARIALSSTLGQYDPHLCLWAGTTGEVWIAGSQPILRRVSASGEVAAFALADARVCPVQQQGDSWDVQTSSVVDGQGRRWFWFSDQSWGNRSPSGVLIWDGTRMAYHATLAGLPDQHVAQLTRLDAGHLWVTSCTDQYPWQEAGVLYRLDTNSLTATLETPPILGEFRHVRQVFQARSVWYAVDENASSPLTASVWRLQTTGWRRCLDGMLLTTGSDNSHTGQAWRANVSGVWLGADGAWWIPDGDGPAVHADWRRGQRLNCITALFPLSADRTLAIGSGSVEAAVLPPSPPPSLTPPHGLSVWKGGPNHNPWYLTADLRHHLWSVPSNGYGPLAMEDWDGLRWRVHLPPASLPPLQGLLASDTLGRLWFAARTGTKDKQPTIGAMLYDTARNTWEAVATLKDALKAAASTDVTLLPTQGTQLSLALSGNGYAASTEWDTVNYYDTLSWHSWRANDLLAKEWGNQSVIGPPELSRDGALTVHLNSADAVWTPQRGWVRVERPYPNPPLPPDSPAGLSPWQYALMPTDSSGAGWICLGGSVYKAWHGRWARQATLSAPGSPFLDGRSLQGVFSDPRGRLFFLTGTAIYPELISWQPPTPPAPRIEVTPMGADSLLLHFKANLAEPHEYLWRVNGAPWTATLHTASVMLTSLPHGNYRVEAQTLASSLAASNQIGAAVFSVRIDFAAQIARWVQTLLTGSDDAREAAAEGLRKQRDLALPALRAARPGAPEQGRWWIDAVLQQIEPEP